MYFESIQFESSRFIPPKMDGKDLSLDATAIVQSIPDDVKSSIDQMTPGRTKDLATAFVAAIAVADECEQQNNSSAAQTILTAANSFTSQLKEEDPDSPDEEVNNLYEVLMAVMQWIEKINHLQAEWTDTTQDLSNLIGLVSDKEQSSLSTIAGDKSGDNLHGEDLQRWLSNHNNSYSQTQTTYNQTISSIQGPLESSENFTKDLGQMSTGGFTQLNSFVQVWVDIAQIMGH